MENEKLMAILTAHSLWWSSCGREGSRANLSGAHLSGADLSVTYFHRWHVTATAKEMRIGCHVHTWADWKAHGKAYAKANDCLAEFTAFWPVLDAARKWLEKQAKAKKP